jgi:hypothetical protein
MRYFIVFYHFLNSDGSGFGQTWFKTTGHYIPKSHIEKTVKEANESKGFSFKGIVITNIIELPEQDFNDFNDFNS